MDTPIFSFFMGNIDTETPTGVLTLGGVNQTHYEGEEMPELSVLNVCKCSHQGIGMLTCEGVSLALVTV